MRKDRPVIIGFGPAGMFAALELLESGLQPIIFERGKKIEDRTIDVDRFIRERVLDPESNIQFGEGGAGSYSDGKLFFQSEKFQITSAKCWIHLSGLELRKNSATSPNPMWERMCCAE